MARLLALETSTLTGAVALLDGERLVAEARLQVAVTHGERLMAAIDGILAAARWTLADVEALAVAVGPGSFTGLRIGVSTAKGLAFATGRPLVGVPTLDALAWSLPFAAHPVCPVLDARKGEVYAALYRTGAGRLEPLRPARALAPGDLAAELAALGEPVILLGDGVEPSRAALLDALGPAARPAPPAFRVPSAASLADLAREALARGETADPAALVPLYVRPSEAELAEARRRRVSPAA
jgi:tRNA threonylcarbamoyladenosine biosynthesis protein TsaB